MARQRRQHVTVNGTHQARCRDHRWSTIRSPSTARSSTQRTADRQPRLAAKESYADSNIAENLTFATVPLTVRRAGTSRDDMAQDRAPAVDLADIQRDIPFIAARKAEPVNWRWYQEGYDHEPTDPAGDSDARLLCQPPQGPQYFGYLANNPALTPNLRGMGDLFDDMASNKLPKQGGVFYIRGGFTNIAGLTPPIQNANFPATLTDADRAIIARRSQGDDDHPSYSDRQISEAMAARVINAVAGNPELWKQSADHHHL